MVRRAGQEATQGSSGHRLIWIGIQLTHLCETSIPMFNFAHQMIFHRWDSERLLKDLIWITNRSIETKIFWGKADFIQTKSLATRKRCVYWGSWWYSGVATTSRHIYCCSILTNYSVNPIQYQKQRTLSEIGKNTCFRRKTRFVFLNISFYSLYNISTISSQVIYLISAYCPLVRWMCYHYLCLD